MSRVLSPQERETVRAAIDQAQRAAAASNGELPKDTTKRARPDTDPLLEEALDEAIAKAAYLEIQNEELRETIRLLTETIRKHKIHVRGNWWHSEARRLRGLGMSWKAIGRRFGVHHTTVMNACGALGKRRDA